mmetsp:Transcript_65711/g.189095  ORF Transcript_65711/g.189095 Transcript_65711/m.189095 type:complete len:293 (+) Transcript_65711:647-1525(+)
MVALGAILATPRTPVPRTGAALLGAVEFRADALRRSIRLRALVANSRLGFVRLRCVCICLEIPLLLKECHYPGMARGTFVAAATTPTLGAHGHHARRRRAKGHLSGQHQVAIAAGRGVEGGGLGGEGRGPAERHLLRFLEKVRRKGNARNPMRLFVQRLHLRCTGTHAAHRCVFLLPPRLDLTLWTQVTVPALDAVLAAAGAPEPCTRLTIARDVKDGTSARYVRGQRDAWWASNHIAGAVPRRERFDHAVRGIRRFGIGQRGRGSRDLRLVGCLRDCNLNLPLQHSPGGQH